MTLTQPLHCAELILLISQRLEADSTGAAAAASQLPSQLAVPVHAAEVAPDSAAGHGRTLGAEPTALLPTPHRSGAAAAGQLPSVPGTSALGRHGAQPGMRLRPGGHAGSMAAPAAPAARQLPTPMSASAAGIVVPAPAAGLQRQPRPDTEPSPQRLSVPATSRGAAALASDPVPPSDGAAVHPEHDTKRAKLLALLEDAMALQSELEMQPDAGRGSQSRLLEADNPLASIPAAGGCHSQSKLSNRFHPHRSFQFSKYSHNPS